MLLLPALSIRQPWAWLIVHGSKNIENRCWRTFTHRGEFLIHAGQGMTAREYHEAVAFAREADPAITVPDSKDLARGGIVGIASLDDCVTRHDSKWFVGQFGWVLSDRRPLPFMPCKGQLGFFTVEYRPPAVPSEIRNPQPAIISPQPELFQ